MAISRGITRKKSLAQYSPTSEMFRQFYNPDLPRSEIKKNERAFNLAKKMKPNGRINVDDVQNAKVYLTNFGPKRSKGPVGRVLRKKKK